MMPLLNAVVSHKEKIEGFGFIAVLVILAIALLVVVTRSFWVVNRYDTAELPGFEKKEAVVEKEDRNIFLVNQEAHETPNVGRRRRGKAGKEDIVQDLPQEDVPQPEALPDVALPDLSQPVATTLPPSHNEEGVTTPIGAVNSKPSDSSEPIYSPLPAL